MCTLIQRTSYFVKSHVFSEPWGFLTMLSYLSPRSSSQRALRDLLCWDCNAGQLKMTRQAVTSSSYFLHKRLVIWTPILLRWLEAPVDSYKANYFPQKVFIQPHRIQCQHLVRVIFDSKLPSTMLHFFRYSFVTYCPRVCRWDCMTPTCWFQSDEEIEDPMLAHLSIYLLITCDTYVTWYPQQRHLVACHWRWSSVLPIPSK